MDPDLIEAILQEIRHAFAGKEVSRIDRGGRYGLFLRFSGPRDGLYLSAHPDWNHLRLAEVGSVPAPLRKTTGPMGAPLKGAVLRDLEREPGGRVVRLRFDREDETHPELVLVGELIPRFANLVLIGSGNRVLGCVRTFDGKERSRQVVPGVAYTPPGAGPAAGAGEEDATPWEGGSPSAEAARRWGEPEADGSRESVATEIRRAVSRRRKRAARTLRKVGERIVEADRAEEIRAQAELLASRPGEVRRGMEVARLPAFDGSGEVSIPLDPKLDARENVDALFRKAKRLARGRTKLDEQRAAQEEAIAKADAVLAELDANPGAAFLAKAGEEFLRDPPPAATSPQAGGDGKAAGLPAGFRPRVYLLPGDWEVWVGRSARQNDELTHRHASPRDLWFHARGAEGSHVVLRHASGKGEPSRETIRATAAIAAHYSKQRNAGVVPVAYTEKRYVRRPRKAPPGTASMIREKVVFVRPGLP
jgi:predicted ribosome quality control (RQC) complex YloA/Tae2 family protein